MSSGLTYSQMLIFQILTVTQIKPILALIIPIKLLMKKNPHLPNNSQQREELIVKLQTEIQKIAPEGTNPSASMLQKKAILEQRIKLISSCKGYGQERIANTQKIFKHYSTHIFKSGQKYDFDQIGYLNDHLTLDRFFAFINDFELNDILINGQKKQLADRNEISLIFKRSSSNARNLDLPEFMACLQRLFAFLFDENLNYHKKKEQARKQKLQRAIQAKKRQLLRKQRQKAKQMLMHPPKALASKPIQQDKAQKQNDAMLKEMLKDFQIVNPTNQVNIALKQTGNSEQQLYEITEEEKIQSYMLRIKIDDRKQIEKKIRYFQKANYKYYEVDQLQKYRKSEPKKRDEQKGNQPLNLKRELTQLHHEWKSDKKQVQKSNINRFIKLTDQLNDRQNEKSRVQMSKSLSLAQYANKKKVIDDKFTRKQAELMFPTAKQRLVKKKEEQQYSTMYYNLEMVHRSQANQLPINRANPQRYISSDPTDHIYLEQYGQAKGFGNKFRGQMSHNNSQLIQSTKRRAAQIQNQQTKRLSRLANNNMPKNHHYLQKFLQRKW